MRSAAMEKKTGNYAEIANNAEIMRLFGKQKELEKMELGKKTIKKNPPQLCGVARNRVKLFCCILAHRQYFYLSILEMFLLDSHIEEHKPLTSRMGLESVPEETNP